MQIKETKLITETRKGTRLLNPVTMEIEPTRITFAKSPFALKDEIKAMEGSKWHGFDDPPRKVWSIKNSQRNRFQLEWLEGGNPYEWFEQEVRQHEYPPLPKPPMAHQRMLADTLLTYHYHIWAAEMGVGKTLAAIMAITLAGGEWWWVGPLKTRETIALEFEKWGGPAVRFFSYEEFTRFMDEWKPGDPLPLGLVCDEASRLKNTNSQRARAVQKCADLIRETHGFDGYVLLMSGTPAPKTPVDWWSLCEIAYPGFLREGSPKAFEQRLAFFKTVVLEDGSFPKRSGWKDDENKCEVCGEHRENGAHELDGLTDPAEFHPFEPSVNEVALLFERLHGLVTVVHKKDCLDLPDKRYRVIECKPSQSTLRVAKALVDCSENAAVGAALLRELSDGFQYREVVDGEQACSHCGTTGKIKEWFGEDDKTYRAIDMLREELVETLEEREVDCPRCNGSGQMPRRKRITREVPCPKEDALVDLLEECEEVGRIVIFAGFQGSVDRVARVCRQQGWGVVRCDGRGWQVTDRHGEVTVTDSPLRYWSDMDNKRVAFVAHPESGGLGLTLIEARMGVFWSNSFKPDSRTQAEDRLHRPGMDMNVGCEIVDLLHLPSDQKVLDVVRENRRIELLTMGELSAAFQNVEAA